jgi:hypothetical protein
MSRQQAVAKTPGAKSAKAPAEPDRNERQPGVYLVLAALLALMFFLGCFPMADFDVWWHLRTGQLILDQGAVPRVDVFTYTNAGRAWVDVYWLFQIVIAGMYRLGGASALVSLKAVAGTAVVALALLARGPNGRAWPAVVVWLPAGLVLTGRLCERPELFSLLFVAAFLAVLGQAARRPNLLWILPPVQMLWVNSHGFFVLGPLALAAYGADWLYDKWRPLPGIVAPQVGRPPLRTLVLAGASTLLVCLINPYGLGAIALPLQQFHKLGKAGIYRTAIGELKSIGDFINLAGMANPYLLSFFLVFLLGLVGFVWLLRRGRLSLFRLLLFAAASYLGWQATRNSALFALVVAVVTTWNFDDALAWSTAAAPAKSRRSRRASAGTPQRRFHLVLLAAMVGLALATASGGLYAWAGEGRTIGFGERPGWYAHEACAFLARPDMPTRIAAFNLGQAAVCIAGNGPAHKEFMDPRLEVNAQETFERYVAGIGKLWRGESDWEVPLGIDYGRPDEIPALLIERGVLSRAIAVLAGDPRWICVHADAVATVFVEASFAKARKLPEVSPQ